MNKIKLLFLFIFGFNLFSMSFCMDNGQNLSGEKRKRDSMEESSSDENDQLDKKRRKMEDEKECISSEHDLLCRLNDLFKEFEEIFSEFSGKEEFNELPEQLKRLDISSYLEEFDKLLNSSDSIKINNIIDNIIEKINSYIINFYKYRKNISNEKLKEACGKEIIAFSEKLIKILEQNFLYRYKVSGDIEIKDLDLIRSKIEYLVKDIILKIDSGYKYYCFDFILNSNLDLTLIKKFLSNSVYFYYNHGYYIYLSWEGLFKSNINVIKAFLDIVDLGDTYINIDNKISFYEDLKSVGENDPIKYVELIRLFLSEKDKFKCFSVHDEKKFDKFSDDIDESFPNFLRIFNISVCVGNIEALRLLKEEVKSKVNDFQKLYFFSDSEFDFLFLGEKYIKNNELCSDDEENDFHGKSLNPLFVAICSRNLEAVKFLIEECSVDTNIISENIDSIEEKVRITPIFLAIKILFKDMNSGIKPKVDKIFSIVKYLTIENHKILNKVYKNNNNQLHLACKFGMTDVAIYFVKNKLFDVEARNANERTALDLLIYDGFHDLNLIFSLIFSAKKDNHGMVLIPDSIKNSSAETIKYFFEILKLLPSTSCNKNCDNFSCNLISNLFEKCILLDLKILLHSSAGLVYEDGSLDKECKEYLLLKKRFCDNFSIICSLVKGIFTAYKEHCDLNKTDKEQIIFKYSILHILNVYASVLKLSVNNINIFEVVCDTETKKLLIDGFKGIIDKFISIGIKNDSIDSNGNTPLHVSCCFVDEVETDDLTGSMSYDCLARHLIEESNSDVNARNKKDFTPLYFAVMSGKKSAIKALLENNASLENLDGKGTKFYTLLQSSAAAKAKHLDLYFEKIRDSKEKFEAMKKNALEGKEPLLDKKYPEDRCQICLRDFCKNLGRVFLVGCGHNFCENCIKKGFIDNDGKIECVSCRKDGRAIEFETEELRVKLEKERNDREKMEIEMEEEEKEKSMKLS